MLREGLRAFVAVQVSIPAVSHKRSNPVDRRAAGLCGTNGVGLLMQPKV